jgi:hypothetical protein
MQGEIKRAKPSHSLRSARLKAENLILRQQLAILQHKFLRRVKLRNIDRRLMVCRQHQLPFLDPRS